MDKPKAWFWDVFPDHCTKAWYGFMILAIVVSFFWRDPTYAWWSTHLWVSIPVMVVLTIVVIIGNIVPGIPNMPAPLLIGWACAAGLSPSVTMNYGLIIWIAATFGSMLGYATGEDSTILYDWNLKDSKRYRCVEEHIDNYEFEDWYVLKSRVGKFAAYCGHVNIAAGAHGYYWLSFVSEAALGHFLWTLQYLAIGFALGHLPEIWKFTVAYTYLVWAAIIIIFIVLMIIYIVRTFRVSRRNPRR